MVVLAVCFAGAEALLRAINVGYGQTPVIPDRVFHHRQPADYLFYSYTPSGEFGGHHIYFDKEGLYSDPSKSGACGPCPRERLVVFLGDSFTCPREVAYESSFFGILQKRHPGLCLKNYAAWAYSPSIYYLQWKYRIAELKPVKVFMLLYSNDIYEDSYYNYSAKFNADKDLIAIEGRRAAFWLKLYRSSFFLRALGMTYQKLRYMLGHLGAKNGHRGAGFGEQFPDMAEPTSSYILKIARQVKGYGGRFYLMAVPSRYNLMHDKADDPQEFSRKCRRWAKNHGLVFIDLNHAFWDYYKKNKELPFYRKDPHFNEAGHALVAEELKRFLN